MSSPVCSNTTTTNTITAITAIIHIYIHHNHQQSSVPAGAEALIYIYIYISQPKKPSVPEGSEASENKDNNAQDGSLSLFLSPTAFQSQTGSTETTRQGACGHNQGRLRSRPKAYSDPFSPLALFCLLFSRLTIQFLGAVYNSDKHFDIVSRFGRNVVKYKNTCGEDLTTVAMKADAANQAAKFKTIKFVTSVVSVSTCVGVVV